MKNFTSSIIIVLVGSLISYLYIRGSLGLFVLPGFQILLAVTGVMFVILGIILGFQAWKHRSHEIPTPWEIASSVFLIVIILLGFVIPLRPLSSVTALQRGISYDAPLSSKQNTTQMFFVSPQERTLMDWLRQFSVQPEPERYRGQPVRIEGFITTVPEAEDTQMIAKFLIACCSADARPIGLPLIKEGEPLTVDQWVRIEGTMTDIVINEVRRPAVQVDKVTPIPIPSNPYEYL